MRLFETWGRDNHYDSSFSMGNVVQPPMLVKEDASSSILVCGTEFKHQLWEKLSAHFANIA